MKSIIVLLLLALSFFGLTEAYSQDNSDHNLPDKTNSLKPRPSGPSVAGIFGGRCGCQELANELKITVSPDCFKTKWSLILLQNPETLAPTAYQLEGSFYRQAMRKGKWRILKGTNTNPDAVVYQLDADGQEKILLLKGDDNVLFFLDKNRNILVGSELFSYSINRVRTE